MTDIHNTACAHRGCSDRPRYGTAGSRSAMFCTAHKEVGMVDVGHKLCAYQGCPVHPVYGREGSGKTEFCSGHKIAGMVDITSKRCGHKGCSKHPSFGRQGSKKREFCSQHKMAGMMHAHTTRCGQRLCLKRPHFGEEGSGKAEFCSEHKTTGMVNIFSKRCSWEGCSTLAVYGLDGSRRQQVLCTRHLTKRHQASSVETPKAKADTKGMKKKAGGQVALPFSRKRAVGVDNFPRQVQKTSGTLDCGSSRAKRMRAIEREKRDISQEPQKMSTLVQESSGNLSTTGFTPIASHDSCHQSRETQNLCRDDRATSRAPRRSMHSECGRDSTRDLAPRSSVAAATTQHRVPPESVARTSTKEREPTGSARTTVSEGGVLRCGGGEGSVSAGIGNACITSRPAGARSFVSAVSSLQCSRSSESCAFFFEHRHKIASLENDNRVAEIEVSALVRKIASLEQENREAVVEVEQLKGTVDDTGVVRADAEARAIKETEQKFTHIVQGLRDELGAASSSLKDTKRAYEAVCEERRALRQQVTTIQAQVASAASKFKAEANKTIKAEESFQQRIEVVRAALNGASMGWQETKNELKEIYLERDGLQEKVATTQAQVASATKRLKAEAARNGKAQQAFQKRIEALGAELTAASTGWEETKGELKQIRKERYALHKEVAETQAQVASATKRLKAEAARNGKAQQAFQKRIEALRAGLTAASTGWEETKGELKQIRKERYALHKELEKQVAFDADKASKAAESSNGLGHQVESIRGEPRRADQPLNVEMESQIVPGPRIPASLLQPIMAGLATIASPAAFAAACAGAQSSGKAPASDLPTSSADTAQASSADRVVEKGQVDGNICVCELKHENARELAASLQRCLEISTVAIKPEG